MFKWWSLVLCFTSGSFPLGFEVLDEFCSLFTHHRRIFLARLNGFFNSFFSPFINSFWFQVVFIFITIFVHIKNQFFRACDKKYCFLLHPVSFLRGNNFQIFKLILLIYIFLSLHVVIWDTVYIVISWYFHFRHYLLTPSMKGKDIIHFHHCPLLPYIYRCVHIYIYTYTHTYLHIYMYISSPHPILDRGWFRVFTIITT